MNKLLLWTVIMLCLIGTAFAVSGSSANYEIEGYFSSGAQSGNTASQNVSLGMGQLVIGNDSTANYQAFEGIHYINEAESDTVPPEITSLNCAPDPANLGQTVQCNATVTDDVGLGGDSITIAINGSADTGDYFDGFVSLGSIQTGGNTIELGDLFSTDFRGFIDFDTSSIPDGSTISDVTLQLNKKTGTDVNISIMKLTDYSKNYTSADLFNECDDSAYVENVTTWGTTGTNANQTLGSEAISDLETNLSDDRFSVCIYSEEAEADTADIQAFESSNSATQAYWPTLYVTYEAAATVEANVTMPNGTVEVQTVNSLGSDIYSFDFTNTNNIGQHNVTWYAEDSSANSATEEDNFTVIDVTNPSVFALGEDPSDPDQYNATQVYNFTANVTDNIGVNEVLLTWDGTNYTAAQDGDTYWVNFTGLAVGTYNYNWWANDTSNNINSTESGSYEITAVPDTTPPNVTDLVEVTSDPATYSPGATYTFNATVLDEEAVDSVKLNFSGTNYTAYPQGAGVYSANVTDLAVGVYNYNWWANDTSNNINSTEASTYEVVKASSHCNLTVSSPVTYPNNVTASATCSNSQQDTELFRNLTTISNPYNELLGVSSYNISTRFNASQNYTAAPVNWTVVTVLKGTPVLNLDISPSDEELYLTETTVTGEDCPAELSCNLYLDESLVANPHIATLSVGEHNYTFNVSSSQNYTSAEVDGTLTILDNDEFDFDLIEIGENFVRLSWN